MKKKYIISALNMIIAPLLLLHCSESSSRDANNDAIIDGDTIADIIQEDSPAIDSVALCVFNEAPIDITLDDFDCEYIMRLEEGTHEYRYASGRVVEVSGDRISLESSEHEVSTVYFSGMSGDDIEARIREDYGVLVHALGMNDSGCVKGISIQVTCSLFNVGVWSYRAGDIHNPVYPREEDLPRPDISPFNIEMVEAYCDISETPFPDCDISEVYNLVFTNEGGDSVEVRQGETAVLIDTLSGESYNVNNNYGYQSDDCGGENLSYLLQVLPSPRLDCE